MSMYNFNTSSLTPAEKEYQRKERERLNRIQMDLLMAAYSKRTANPNLPSAESIKTSQFGRTLFDEFYKAAQPLDKQLSEGYTVTSTAVGPNDFLLNARTPAELLQLAGITKPSRSVGIFSKERSDYAAAEEAADSLIRMAKDTSRIGGDTAFGFANEVTDKQLADRYNVSKFTPAILEELNKKYAALGPLQRGLLKNETETTEDDERVLFNQSTAFQVDTELKKMQTDFKKLTDDINKEFTLYGQHKQKIGTYQTAALSEDQMFKQILQNIRSSYSTFEGEADSRYVGDKYFSERPTQYTYSTDVPDAAAYLKTLPGVTPTFVANTTSPTPQNAFGFRVNN